MSLGDQNYKEACSHCERGELEEAITLFSRAIDSFFRSSEKEKEAKAYYYRGCAYYRLGIQCERKQVFAKSKENLDNALGDFEKVTKKIDINSEKEKSDYYKGCAYYKLGLLYEKKRITFKSERAFREVLTYLGNALNCDLYRENGKLWFYKGISNYKLGDYNNCIEDFKEAMTYDYYDIEIFKKLLPGNPHPVVNNPQENLNNILLLYYLKRYSEIINNYSNDTLHKNCLDNLINDYICEGAYYCALSHYEFKDFRRSFEIFDKLTEIKNKECSKKFRPISWYYKGLILHELRNVCNLGDFREYFSKRYEISIDKYRNNFKKVIDNDIRIKENYKKWENEERKKFTRFIYSEFCSGELEYCKCLEYLERCMSVEATESSVNESCAFAWWFKAKTCEKQGDELKAQTAFQKAIDIESKRSFEQSLKIYAEKTTDYQNPGLCYEKALVLDELKRYNEAIESLDEFLKNKPRDAKAWLKKGTILLKLAKYEEIKTTCEESKKENKEEKSACEREITKIEAAKNALEKSIQYFKILIGENPGNPDHWYNRGTAHSSLAEVFIKTRDYQDSNNEYEEAVKAFDNATVLNPIFALAWNNKGNAYLKLKKYNKAIEAFEKAFEINSNYYLALHNKGDALYSLGKYEEASGIYDDVVYEGKTRNIERQSDPNVYKSWNDKGLALYKLEKYDEAVKAFDEAIEINPTFADGWTNKGVVFYKLEMFSEAKEAFEEALKIDPGNALASNNLGVVLATIGELDRAKKLFENTLQENPDFILGRANLAELLLNNGGIEEASEKIECILKNEKNPDTNMGYIHFLDGRIKIENMESKEKKYSEAAKSFEKATSFNVDEPTFLLWSIYAKYLCQKFETDEKTNSSEEPKLWKENVSPKAVDIRYNELFNLIISDLEKILTFCKKPAITRNSLPESINRDLSLQVTLFFCTAIFFTIALILGIKFLHFIGELLGIQELVRSTLDIITSIIGPPLMLFVMIIVIINITKTTRVKREAYTTEAGKKETENSRSGSDKHKSASLLDYPIYLLRISLPLLAIVSMIILIMDLGIFLQSTNEFLGVPELLGSTPNIFLLVLSLLLSILFLRLILLYTDTLKGFEITGLETVGSKIEEKINLYLVQLGVRIFHLELVLNWIISTLRSTVQNTEDLKLETNVEKSQEIRQNLELKHIIALKTQLVKFDAYKEIKAYTLYLLGYFYYRLQDYTTAKEKLQECISLRPDSKTDKDARKLLDGIWKHKIRPPFWTYWFNSPVKTWRRRAFGTFIILGILLILFVHAENPQPVAWNNSTFSDPGNNIPNYIPDQINLYPYIISYHPSNNTSSELTGSPSNGNNAGYNDTLLILFVHVENSPEDWNESTSNYSKNFILSQINFYPYIISYYLSNNTSSELTGSPSNGNNANNNDTNVDNENINHGNNNTTWNILTPTRVNIYPDLPMDNFFDALLLLILILILISPSIRITEAVKVALKKGVGDVSLNIGPIETPPEFNFELTPSLMQDVIRRLDENV